LRLFSQAADVHGCAIARYRLGVVQARVGNLDAAISEYERSRHDAHEAGDAFVEAGVLRELGSAHQRRGDLEVAAACLTEALRLHEGVGSLRGKALTLHTLGELRLRQGDPHAARAVFQRVLDMIQPLNDIVGKAYATLGLAEALASAGLRGEAEERSLMALQLARQIRNPAIQNRAQLVLDQLKRPATRSEYSQQAAGTPG
jgi:tetratricopeptide (TPR) repeat protein